MELKDCKVFIGGKEISAVGSVRINCSDPKLSKKGGILPLPKCSGTIECKLAVTLNGLTCKDGFALIKTPSRRLRGWYGSVEIGDASEEWLPMLMDSGMEHNFVGPLLNHSDGTLWVSGKVLVDKIELDESGKIPNSIDFIGTGPIKDILGYEIYPKTSTEGSDNGNS